MKNFYDSMIINRISSSNDLNSHTSKGRNVLFQDIEHLAPIEFFDTITNELMKTPYILPSGKNIDQVTLNKYLATKDDPSQATDPFTRLPFTELSKPLLNTELKTRIDLFYLTNGQSEIDRRNELRRRLLNLP